MSMALRQSSPRYLTSEMNWTTKISIILFVVLLCFFLTAGFFPGDMYLLQRLSFSQIVALVVLLGILSPHVVYEAIRAPTTGVVRVWVWRYRPFAKHPLLSIVHRDDSGDFEEIRQANLTVYCGALGAGLLLVMHDLIIFVR